MLYIMHMLYVIRLITFSKYLSERILRIDMRENIYLIFVHHLFFMKRNEFYNIIIYETQ